MFVDMIMNMIIMMIMVNDDTMMMMMMMMMMMKILMMIMMMIMLQVLLDDDNFMLQVLLDYDDNVMLHVSGVAAVIHTAEKDRLGLRSSSTRQSHRGKVSFTSMSFYQLCRFR